MVLRSLSILALRSLVSWISLKTFAALAVATFCALAGSAMARTVSPINASMRFMCFLSNSSLANREYANPGDTFPPLIYARVAKWLLAESQREADDLSVVLA